MMKKRLEALEEKKIIENGENRLKILAEKWRQACNNYQWDRAEQIRNQAEELFEHCPEWEDARQIPFLGRVLFMDWEYFVNFLDEEVRQEYMQAITSGMNPGSMPET